MQARKLKGKVDRTGKLIITEPTDLTPGEVEIIVLQLDNSLEVSNSNVDIERPSKVNAFTNWFTKTQPLKYKSNTDEMKWNYLQEKHNL